ncbi:MAG: hypothetical protein M3P49_08110, partial [Actinomycetota bacterium]|nr:hypothetical protein [Actinomycetota bacterium]
MRRVDRFLHDAIVLRCGLVDDPAELPRGDLWSVGDLVYGREPDTERAGRILARLLVGPRKKSEGMEIAAVPELFAEGTIVGGQVLTVAIAEATVVLHAQRFLANVEAHPGRVSRVVRVLNQ